MPYAVIPNFDAPAQPAPAPQAAAAPQVAPFNLDAAVDKYSKQHGVDPKLIHAMVKQESGGRQDAVSPKGARGLMQIMPDTAKELGIDPNDPEQNIEGGTRYMSRLLKRYNGDVKMGLAAFNAGMGNVDKYGGIPPFDETVNYVKNISAALMGPQPQQPMMGPPAPEQPTSRFAPIDGWGEPPPVPEPAPAPPPPVEFESPMGAGASAFGETLGMAVRGALDSNAARTISNPNANIGNYFNDKIRRAAIDMLPQAESGDTAAQIAQGAGSVGADLLAGGGVQAGVRAPLQAAANKAALSLPLSVKGTNAALKAAPYAAASAENAVGFGAISDPNNPAQALEYGLIGGVSGPLGQGARAARGLTKAALATGEAATIAAGPAALEGRAPTTPELAMGALPLVAAGISGRAGQRTQTPPPLPDAPPPLPEASQLALDAPPARPALPDLRGDVIYGQDARGQSGPPIRVEPNAPLIEGANPAQRQIPDLRSQVIEGQAPPDLSLAVPQGPPTPKRDVTRNPTSVSPEVLPLTGPPELAPGPYLPSGEPLIGYKGPRTSDRAAAPLTERPARPEQTATPLEADPVRAAAAELTAAQKATAAAEKAYNKKRTTENADALRAASATEQAASAKLQQAMTGGRDAKAPATEVPAETRAPERQVATQPELRQEPTQAAEPVPQAAGQRVKQAGQAEPPRGSIRQEEPQMTQPQEPTNAIRPQNVRENASPTKTQGQSAPKAERQGNAAPEVQGTKVRDVATVDAEIARLQEIRDAKETSASERRKAERTLDKLYDEYNRLVEEESGRALNPGKLVDKVLSKFRSRGDLPPALDRLVQQRKGRINEADRAIELALIDVDRAMRKVYGRRPKPVDIDLLRSALEGKVPTTQLPAELQGPMDALRKGTVGIDTLSSSMLRNNLVQGDLAKTIKDNLGEYTRRAYRAWDTSNWESIVRRDNPNAVATAKAEIRKNNIARWQSQGKSAAEINQLVEGAFIKLVSKVDDAKSPLDFINAKLGHEELGFLKRRKDLPSWLREVLGEYEDPRAIYARTSSGMSHFIVNSKFLQAVEQVGTGKYFHKEPIEVNGTRYTEKLGNERAFGKLSEMYTTKEIKAEFENAFQPRELNKTIRALLAVNGVAKYSKTVGNVPQGYVRNFTSNILLTAANGNVNPTYIPQTLSVMKSRLFDKGGAAVRKEDLRLTRLGVVADSANYGEFRAAIGDIVGHSRSINDFQNGVLAQSLKYTGHTLKRWWAAIDDVFKVFNFYNEEAKYRKAYPKWSAEQVAQKAAELTSNQMPTYSRAPAIVQSLRRNPIISPFATFPSEVIRNTSNIIVQAAKEIRDPATRSIGMQRAAGVASAIAIAAAIEEGSKEQQGITSQQESDLRKFMPEYSRHAPILWMGEDEKGNRKYVDLTYAAPHSVLLKPVMAAMDEDTPLDKVQEFVKEAAGPYWSPELFPKAVWDVVTNESPRVRNPQDTLAGQAADSLPHIAKAFEPGTSTNIRRAVKAVKGEKGPSGQEYNLGDEAVGVATGARKQRVDVLKTLSFSASRYAGTKSDTTRLFTDTARSKQKVSADALKGDYDKAVGQKRKRFNEIADMAHAALRLGYDEAEVLSALIEGGIGENEALYILVKQPPTLVPSDDTLIDAFKAGGDERLNDVIRAIGED